MCKRIRRNLVSVAAGPLFLVLITQLQPASAQVHSPFVGSGGTGTADGSVLVLGQFAAGLVGTGDNEVHLGVVPCWGDDAPPCPGDLDGDASVGLQDLAVLLAHFGVASGATLEDGDLDGDGDVDLGDLASLLASFGSTC